jgi:hypothetical protein
MADSTKVFTPGWRAEDDNGIIIAGGTIEFFDAGTTNPMTVYSDKDLLTSLGTTVDLNAGGYPVSSGGTRVIVYAGTDAYRIRLKDDDDVVVWEHDNVQGALDTGGFDDLINAQLPAGTVQIFGQTNAPPGWTKSVTHDDAMPRLVSGSAASGGTNAVSSVFANRTLTQGNLPSANLVSSSLSISGSQVGGIVRNGSLGGSGAPFSSPASLQNFSWNTTTLGIAGTVPLGGSGTSISFDPKYVDFIIATKD